jgi:catechol 2,3-dioxygenase-like lactoylglutathione lyase family enzyme
MGARHFDHVDLRVADLKTAAPFYQALLPALGFVLRVEIEGWLQFEAAGEGATEFFGVTEDRAHVANRTCIAFWAGSRARVDALAGVLPQIGARAIEGPGVEGEGYYAVYFEDPSGNRLEIVHRAGKFGGD